jgi:GNAT superfamily N-acetyltransferase
MDESGGTNCIDKLGAPFVLVGCDPGDFSPVLDMYDSFMPEAVAQGLPPTDKDVRRKWIRNLLEEGVNYAAVKDGKVVGHAALLPNMEQKDAEYLIFVGGPHRKRGLGAFLTQAALKKAQDLGLSIVWLTVESDNFRAIRLYKKMGFDFCDRGLSEIKMACKI